MATWPAAVADDAPNPHQAIVVSPPAYADNSSHAKSDADVFVEQQWRDVVTNKAVGQHSLSLNRDSAYVTDDPYSP